MSMDIVAAIIGTLIGTGIGIWLGFRWLNKAINEEIGKKRPKGGNISSGDFLMLYLYSNSTRYLSRC